MTDLLWGLTAVGGLAVCVAAHIAAARALPGRSRLGYVLASFFAGGAAVAGLAAARALGRGAVSLDLAALALNWLLAYVCLAYCYFGGFYNCGESARRIRLLRELLDAGQDGLSRAEVLERYNAEMIVRARLERLLAGGQLVLREGRYFIGRKDTLWASWMLTRLKVLFLGAPSADYK